MKPFSESSEENKQPILAVLQNYFSQVSEVLEIGSGTGQHAVFFAAQFPHLQWICSDRAENLPGIQLWLDEAQQANIQGPHPLDVNQPEWPVQQVAAVFSANTVHIMDWPSVEVMFGKIGQLLQAGGVFCLYGPFNYHGTFTSDSNARFDQWLKDRDPRSGIRDIDDLQRLAQNAGLELIQDHEMPVNNRTLVWRKTEI